MNFRDRRGLVGLTGEMNFVLTNNKNYFSATAP